MRLLGHRQTKGAETDQPHLLSPRHISTLPEAAVFGGRQLEIHSRLALHVPCLSGSKSHPFLPFKADRMSSVSAGSSGMYGRQAPLPRHLIQAPARSVGYRVSVSGIERNIWIDHRRSWSLSRDRNAACLGHTTHFGVVYVELARQCDYPASAQRDVAAGSASRSCARSSLPRSAADIATYEEAQETMAFLKILALGNKQIAEGKVKPVADVVKRLRSQRVND